LDYEVFDLVPERFYRFRAYAIDVNGPGTYSNEISLQACVPPDNIERPVIMSIQRESFTMSWSAPSYSGGCPITSYTLLRDDGNGSDVNMAIDPELVPIRPYLFEYSVTLDSSFTGKFVNVKV
jgi:hypothetical protein